jgi:hypothetical protein
MSIPGPSEILQIDADRVSEFIQMHTNEKTLSHLVKRLNEDLIAGDETASEMAARALSHLGFAENA